jgi:hypothetical protein
MNTAALGGSIMVSPISSFHPTTSNFWTAGAKAQFKNHLNGTAEAVP